MGSNTSKTNNDTTDNSIKNNIVNNDNLDPRSPTPEISRTPLHNKSGSKHNITKNVDLRKTFESTNGEETLILNNPILSAVIKNHLQSYDPRSPTQDFERTPIIISSKTDELDNNKRILNLENENLASPVLALDENNSSDRCTEVTNHSPNIVVPKNLCDGFYDLTLNDTLNDAEEPLGSSTASNEAIENVMTNDVVKSTKFLETDFDYVENEEKVESTEEIVENNNNHNQFEEYNTIPTYKILGDDPRSPSIGIERTPIVVSKIDEDANEDNVEEMSDDTLIKVLQSTNAELRQIVSKPQDKKTEGLLVYEDECSTLNETPKKSKSASNSGCRTPLSCMKNKADVGHARSKSANMLFDPMCHKNVITKIPKRVSHIPRLKILTKQTKLPPAGSSVSLKNISKTAAVSGDCENTPPHSHRDRWDKDSSIVL